MAKELPAIAGECDLITNAATDRTIQFTQKINDVGIDFTHADYTEFTFVVKATATSGTAILTKTLTDSGGIEVDALGNINVTFTDEDLDLDDVSYEYSLTYVLRGLVIPLMIGAFILKARA